MIFTVMIILVSAKLICVDVHRPKDINKYLHEMNQTMSNATTFPVCLYDTCRQYNEWIWPVLGTQ